MKKALFCIALMCVFSLAAFAVTGTAKMELTSPAQVAGKQLAPGNYNLSWTGEGNDVQVTITKAHKTVATAPAKIVERNDKAAYNAVVKGDNGNLKQVWFGGKKTALVFND